MKRGGGEVSVLGEKTISYKTRCNEKANKWESVLHFHYQSLCLLATIKLKLFHILCGFSLDAVYYFVKSSLECFLNLNTSNDNNNPD